MQRESWAIGIPVRPLLPVPDTLQELGRQSLM
jgi:hypothetical protein